MHSPFPLGLEMLVQDDIVKRMHAWSLCSIRQVKRCSWSQGCTACKVSVKSVFIRSWWWSPLTS